MAEEVTDVHELLDEIKSAELKRVTKAVWQHVEHAERRAAERIVAERDLQTARARGDSLHLAALAASVDNSEQRIALLESEAIALRVELTGKGGDNGKLGTLRGQVNRQWWIVGILLTASLSAAGIGLKAMLTAGNQQGRDQSRIDRNERDIQDLRLEVDTLRAEFWRARVAAPQPDPGDSTP